MRPESLVLVDAGASSADDPHCFNVDVIGVEDLGRHLLVRLRLGQQLLCALHPEGAEIPEVAALRFDPARTLLYESSLLVEANG